MATTRLRDRRAVAWLAVVALILLAVVASAGAIVFRPRGEATGDREVRVIASATLAASGLDPRDGAVLLSPDRSTTVTVRLTRTAGSAAVPALRADFDGSGGGDAVVVVCTSRAVDWVVGVGSPQTAQLTCDRAVDAWRVADLRSVHLDLVH